MAELDKHGNNQKRGRGNPNWVKGQPSANPNGRPKKDCSLTSLLKVQLDDLVPGDKTGRTWRQLLVERWLTKALIHPAYFKELIERVEGKVPQATEITGKDGGPVVMITDEQLAAKLQRMAANVRPND